jgi:hypothetical protein
MAASLLSIWAFSRCQYRPSPEERRSPKAYARCSVRFAEDSPFNVAINGWDYQPDQLSIDAAARDACAAYEQVGRGQLEFLAEPNSPMNTLTPEAFTAGTFDFKGFGNTVVLTTWTLTRMRKAAGKNTEARGFAELALKEIGDGLEGSSLKAGLRKLLETA